MKRRNTYKLLEQQVNDMKCFSGDINDFLISCCMKMKMREPKESELQRCYELLQRTNQLNISGRRLEYDEVVQIYLQRDKYSTFVLNCQDKYGNYGLVGFAIVKNEEIPMVTDLVISCRVANKKVEHAALKRIFKLASTHELKICFKETNRNGPMAQMIKDLGMTKDSIGDYYIWDGTEDLDLDRIVEVY